MLGGSLRQLYVMLIQSILALNNSFFKVLQKYPRLHKFEHAWPIETYFDMWVRNDKWKRARRNNPKSKNGDRTPWRGNSEPTAKKIKPEEERTFRRPYRTRAVLGDIRNVSTRIIDDFFSVYHTNSVRSTTVKHCHPSA